MKIAVGIGVVLLVVYLTVGQSLSPSSVRGAGIGAPNRNGISGQPLGQIISSSTSLLSSLIGGAGTHAPVDSSIRPPGAMGSMVTSYDQLSGSRVPSPGVIQTQIEGYSPNSEPAVYPTDSPISPDEFYFGG